MILTRPILLDVTRLIATGWKGLRATGIDRVCDAYLSRYRDCAHAVIQHRGVFRVLSEKHSDILFSLLMDRDFRFRSRLARLTPRVLTTNTSQVDGSGCLYLNIGHTDFDLDSHHQWIQRCNLKSIYLIHDLIPLEFPEYCLPNAVRRHTNRVLNAIHSASGIIVNSNATARNLNNFAKKNDLTLPPLLAAHLGVEHISSRDESKVDVANHFVCIGTIEPRKNHLMLLRIWQKLIAKKLNNTPQLIIIGQWGNKSENVRDLLNSDPELAKHVAILNRCTDKALVDWMKSAKAVLLPTCAEGFGLPLTESMAMKTPVIASDLPCFKELGQNIPLLLPSNDEAAWQEAILAFLNDREDKFKQRELLENFVLPSWDNHFLKVDCWLEQFSAGNKRKNLRHPNDLQSPLFDKSPVTVRKDINRHLTVKVI